MRTRQAVHHLITTQGPITTADIAAAVYINPNSVGYHLRALETNRQITRRQAGVRTLWSAA